MLTMMSARDKSAPPRVAERVLSMRPAWARSCGPLADDDFQGPHDSLANAAATRIDYRLVHERGYRLPNERDSRNYTRP
jgi:hypothetical protein